MRTGVPHKRIATRYFSGIKVHLSPRAARSPIRRHSVPYSWTPGLLYVFVPMQLSELKTAPCSAWPQIRALGSQHPNSNTTLTSSLRKEVIQPHVLVRLPCYDFTPVIRPAFGSSSLSVRSLTSGISDSHGVTGGVYKTRERIHRGMLIHDY